MAVVPDPFRCGLHARTTPIPGRHQTSCVGKFARRGAADESARTHDTLKHRGLLVPTLDSVPAEDHPYFARCVVRANLPKPLSVGLECYDATGAYVGTKRAVNVDRLAFEVWSAITYGSPSSRPLHSYRYIYVEPFYDRYERFDW